MNRGTRIVDVVLLASLPMLGVLIVTARHLRYESGFVGRPAGPSFLLSFALLAAIPSLFVVATVQLSRGGFAFRRSWRYWHRFVAFALFGASLIVSAWFAFDVGGSEPFARGFRDRVRQDVDLRALRKWHGQQAAIPVAEFTQIPIEQMPADIRRLRPAFAFQNADGSVDIVFGSGFGHWGITVISQGAKPPDAADYAPLLGASPNVYVWCDKQ